MSSSLSKKIITYDAVERYHDNLEEQLNNEYLRKDELIQSDWDCNYTASNEYIKNRTHYSGPYEDLVTFNLQDGWNSGDKLCEVDAYYFDDKTLNDTTKYFVCVTNTATVESFSYIPKDQLRIELPTQGPDVSATWHKVINDPDDPASDTYKLILDNNYSIDNPIEITVRYVYKQLCESFIPSSIARVDDVNDMLPIEKGTGENSIVQKGSNNVASGTFSVALGKDSNASGNYSFAFGNSVASGEYSHAEGVAAVENGVTKLTKAIGKASHAEGGATKALSEVAHAEGLKTISGRISQLIDPTTGNIRELTNEEYSILVNEALRIGLITSQNEFNNDVAMKLIGFASHSEGSETKALGTSSHAEGNNTEASSNSSHAEGDSTHAWGEASHAEGYLTEANGNQSHSEGKQTKAQGNSSHAEGIETTASKEASHAEGTNTIASGNSSHAEGIETQANGWGSHAEGGYSITTGSYSHIEGRGNYIGDNDSYSTEVVDTNTKAYCAHSEGQGTKAIGNSAHAEGVSTKSLGTGSHTEGLETIANNPSEHASGQYNISTKSSDKSQATQFSIGIGTSDTNRKNAFEVKQNGDIYVDGVEERIQDRLNIDLLVPIEHSDLKKLRDSNQLIPGQKYRITDYITTTTQENTSSMFHPFDVVVTALDNHTLSENASAVKSGRDDDDYFYTENVEAWQLKYCLDNDTERFAWADNNVVQWYSRIVANYMVDQSGTHAYSLDKDAYIYDFGTMPHPDTGEDALVFYTQNPIYFEEAGADYGDIYFYNGITTVDGVEYDSWRKFDGQGVYWVNSESDGEGVFALTKRVVYNGQFIWPDNTGVENGKGVIYNMIDEYGNECPYDFKNIKFYHDGLGTDVYTFTWIDEEYNVMDTSIFGNNGTLTYYDELHGVYGNVIKPYMDMMYDEGYGEYFRTKQSLNNITFISDYEYEYNGNDGFHGCYNNSFGNNCNRNSFGNDCYSNSFGNSCFGNSFGNDCYSNSFGNSCSHNSFGDGCYDNSFGNNYYYNSFGNYCYSNSFGNYCRNNSFGNSCSHNSFGNNCYYNSFGNSCFGNSFGNDCYSNSFGNSCSHNSFGDGCYSNSFRSSASTTETLLNYCSYNHFDDGCSYNVIWNSVQPNPLNKLQNIHVARGVSGTASAYNFINMVDKNTDYEIKVAKNSSGEIKVYCEADLIA